MSHSDDFDVLLTSVLQHTTYDPNGQSAKPIKSWLVGSTEKVWLEGLQAALAVRLTAN